MCRYILYLQTKNENSQKISHFTQKMLFEVEKLSEKPKKLRKNQGEMTEKVSRYFRGFSIFKLGQNVPIPEKVSAFRGVREGRFYCIIFIAATQIGFHHSLFIILVIIFHRGKIIILVSQSHTLRLITFYSESFCNTWIKE